MTDAPRQIGKYRIDGELGRGAMGVVYRAYDLVVERPVAVKTIHVPTGCGMDLLDILRREAKSVGRLEHPNIVTLYDAGEIEGVFCMVMQLVEGESLRDLLQRQRWFQAAHVVSMFRQILDGLGYAHLQGIIHRDIKPANIMIQADGTIKLADFGIAKLIGPTASSSGLIVGTPSYMSPEQVLGRNVDARSDIFAVGCTLYEVLTGEKAYQGDSASSVMYRIVHQAPAPPARLRPGTHPGLEAVVLKALANDPADRFADCRAMTQALETCLKESPAPLLRFRSGRAFGRPAVREQRPGRRWPLGVFATAAALVLALAATFVVLSVTRKSPSPQATSSSPLPDTLKPPTPDLSPVPQTETVQVPAPSIARPPGHRPIPSAPRVPQPAPTVDEFTAALLRGDIAFERSAYDEALSAYLQANALRAGDPGVRRKLRVVLTLLGRAGEAQTYQ